MNLAEVNNWLGWTWLVLFWSVGLLCLFASLNMVKAMVASFLMAVFAVFNLALILSLQWLAWWGAWPFLPQ